MYHGPAAHAPGAERRVNDSGTNLPGRCSRAISQFSAGRRSKWIVIAAWVIVVAAVGGYSGKLQDATTNENEDYLPASAD